MTPFDARRCVLGEGPLWHPLRKQLFWFDIQTKRLLTQGPDGPGEWVFSEHHSAAGWVDRNSLLIASETALWHFDLLQGKRRKLCALEADDPVTRSNDGRADPWGGFWIGTMGKHAEKAAGAIYRYYRGDLRRVVGDITVSNAICFAPDRSYAYYTDTVTQKIMRQPLDGTDGWPNGPTQILVDLTPDKLNPDGAVTDAKGNIWVALWDASALTCFSPAGVRIDDISLPVDRPTCPAFGGPNLCDLYITSASIGLPESMRTPEHLNGATLLLHDVVQGSPEPQVIL